MPWHFQQLALKIGAMSRSNKGRAGSSEAAAATTAMASHNEADQIDLHVHTIGNPIVYNGAYASVMSDVKKPTSEKGKFKRLDFVGARAPLLKDKPATGSVHVLDSRRDGA